MTVRTSVYPPTGYTPRPPAGRATDSVDGVTPSRPQRLSRRPFLAALAVAALSVTAVLLPTASASASDVVDTIAVGDGPIDVAFSSDGSRAFVINYLSSTVSVIDTDSRTVVSTIPTGTQPVRMAARPDGAEVWVSNAVDDTISVIDIATASVVATIPAGNGPVEIAFSPDSSRAYVALADDGAVAVFDAAARTALGAIPVFGSPLALVMSPDGTRLYASETNVNSVAEIDTASGSVLRQIAVSNAHSLAISLDGSTLYASQFTSNGVVKVDLASATASATASLSGVPFMIELSPDGTSLLVPRPSAADLTILDADTLAVRENVNVGPGLRSVIARPGSTELYGPQMEDDRVRVLQLDTAPAITTATLSDGVISVAYSATVAAIGYPAPTFAVTGGGLPAGLTLDASGAITGTPTASGSFSVEMTATNSSGSDAETFVFVVGQVPTISTITLGDAVLDAPYSATVAASGFPAPTFAVTAGALPAGLTLDGATGVISGTPTAGGPATFTVTASNTVAGSAALDDQQFTLLVATPPAFTSTALGSARQGAAYAATLAASGMPAPTFAVTAGALPAGLTLDATSGELSGTPTVSGTFTFTVTASNTAGSTDAALSLEVAAAPAAPAIAATGADPAPITLVATAALLAGAAMLLLRRRRARSAR